jgi:hypothetical protein
MPFFVIIAWWAGKPLTLVFDLFEVAMLLASVVYVISSLSIWLMISCTEVFQPGELCYCRCKDELDGGYDSHCVLFDDRSSFSNTPYVIADEDRTEQGIVTWFYPGQVEVKEFVGADAVADAIVKGPRSLHS